MQQNFQANNSAQSFQPTAQVYDNFNNSFNQQNWQQPMQPQPVPKKSKTWLIVLIVVAVLVAAGIGALAQEFLRNTGSSSDVPYTKGDFDGSVYTNEWADIRYELPEGYNDADSYYYSSAESENVDCGLYTFSEDLTSFMYISFEKLPTSLYDEEDYLDSALKVLEETSGESLDVDYSDDYEPYTIAGYEYLKASGEIDNGISTRSFGFFVRKIDGYMVLISACDATDFDVDEIVDDITTFN